eukprot:scaffold11138_cov111-Isochrysis_galbana.AAC.7
MRSLAPELPHTHMLYTYIKCIINKKHTRTHHIPQTPSERADPALLRAEPSGRARPLCAPASCRACNDQFRRGRAAWGRLARSRERTPSAHDQ